MTTFVNLLLAKLAADADDDNIFGDADRAADAAILPLSDAVDRAVAQLEKRMADIERPSPSDALAAVLMDAALISPASLSRHSFVTLLRVPDGSSSPIAHMLSEALPGGTTNHYDGNRGVLVVRAAGRRDDFIETAMRAGSGVVLGDSKLVMSPTQIDAAQWPGGYVVGPTTAGDQRVPKPGIDQVIVQGKTRSIAAAAPTYIDGTLVRLDLTIH